jgi:hypothetical protein
MNKAWHYVGAVVVVVVGVWIATAFTNPIASVTGNANNQ